MSARLKRAFAIVGLYYLILVYPVVRLGTLLFPDWRPDTVELLLIIVGPAAIWLVHQRVRNPVTRTLLRTNYTWLGACFVLLFVLLPWELVLLLLDVPAPYRGGVPLVVFLIAALWGIANALRLTVVRVPVETPKVETPVRVVQVSDVHVGSRHSGFLQRVVDRVNDLDPDFVLITGDLIDLRALPEDALTPLSKLSAPAYFAIGNHERYIEADPVCEELESMGILSLRNASIAAHGMQIVGIDDADAHDHVERTLETIRVDADPFSILLYHRPHGAEAAARAGIDLMLAGHTHNGQIVPFDRLVRRVYPRIAGRYDVDGTLLYVSSGTGTWGPIMRLGSSNEITVFEIGPA